MTSFVTIQRVLFHGALLIAGLFFSSCAHEGVTIRETPFGLSEIRRVVTTVIGDPRVMSANGYELSSVYMDRKDKPLDRPTEVRERYYVLVSILGDRRPYDVNIRANVEVRTPDGYELLGDNPEMSQRWADRIRQALHESRDKRNVIDDFKAF